jgi:hypothetical protein
VGVSDDQLLGAALQELHKSFSLGLLWAERMVDVTDDRHASIRGRGAEGKPVLRTAARPSNQPSGSRSNGITDAEARGHFAAWAAEDRYFPLDEDLAALRRAGFAEVECFWRRGSSVICCALKNPQRTTATDVLSSGARARGL